MAKVDNRKNPDGHVVSEWKRDDFFRVELEVEHLVAATAAGASFSGYFSPFFSKHPATCVPFWGHQGVEELS